MKMINEKKYYSAREVGMLVDRHYLTIHFWDKWSTELEKEGKQRLIPEPITIGKQNARFWSEEDIEAIKTFRDSIKRGDLANFTKRLWDLDYRREYNKQLKRGEC